MAISFLDLQPENQNRIILQRYDSRRRFTDQPVSEFCIENGIDICFMQTVIKAFEQEEPFPKKELSFFDTRLIIEYLEKTHEYYLTRLLPELEQTLLQLIRTIGFSDPLPILIFEELANYRKELQEHIQEEETQLFPYVNALLNGDVSKENYSINTFLSGHHHKEDQFALLRELIKTKTSVADAFPYKVFLTKLELLERDLHLHAKIEDEVLVPKVLLLEKVK